MTKQADIQLPGANEAMGVLDQVYAEVFFNKMAEYGFSPSDEKEAYSMLETAAYLDSLPEDTQTKQAEYAPFTEANARLKEVLASHGAIDQEAEAYEQLASIKQAAYALAQNPDLYKAVLSVKAAEAEQYEAEEGDGN